MAADETPTSQARRDERPRDAFQRAVVGMGVVGIDSRWRRVNAALCRMLDRPENELIGAIYHEHIHPEDAFNPVEAGLRLLSGEMEYSRSVRRFLRPDGTAVWLTCTACALRGDGGKPYFFLQFEDASEQITTQELSKQSREWLRTVVAHSPVTVIALDLEGHILVVEGEALGDPQADRLAPRPDATVFEVLADNPVFLDAYRRAVAGEHVRYTERANDPIIYDVEMEPVRNEDGMIAYILSVGTNVTDRATMEDALRVSSARQEVVADLGRLALERVPLQRLRQVAADAIREQLRCDVAGVFEVDGPIVRLVATSGLPAGAATELSYSDDDRTPVVTALRTGRVAATTDLSTDDRYEPWAMLREQGIRAVVAVPIGLLDEQYGALSCYSAEPREFDEIERTFLENVAYVLGAAIHRLRGEEAIRHRAVHDELTGLPNRTLLVDRLGVALSRTRRGPEAVTVVYVDLDGFKTVNDTLGHAIGDDLLRWAAERLREVVRPGDTVARLAGDEFAIMCEDLGGPRAAVRLAQRILAALGEPMLLGDREVTVSASVGVAMSGPDADEPETLLRDADIAMYAAKRQGRGRYEAFDQVMRARVSRRVEIENDLRRAAESGQLRMAYQPILNLAGQMAGVEALMRWDHPRRGAVPPGEFVPLAEEAGLIVPLGEWALQEACRAAEAYGHGGPEGRPLRMAVNVSARQLADPNLVDAVTRAVGGSCVGKPWRLVIEITETALMDNVDIALPVLEAVRELGANVAIDDFGTGYSSLSRLRRLPVDCLKIDQSFVTGLGVDPADDAIVETVIRLAHALDLVCIAEGVETAVQLEVLRALHCDMIQGHYVAPPEIDLRTAEVART